MGSNAGLKAFAGSRGRGDSSYSLSLNAIRYQGTNINNAQGMSQSGYLQRSQQKSKQFPAPYKFLSVDKLFKLPLIISTCLLAMAHGSNEVNVSAPTAAMIFLLNDADEISDSEAY